MTLYIDVLFAINFSMDFISLFATSHITHKRVLKKRILIASLIGALYSVLEIIYPIKNFWISVSVSMLISFVMCMISYCEGKVASFLKMIVIFWGISVALGGFMSVIYSLLNKLLAEYIENYSYEHVYSGARFFIIIALTLVASVVFGRAFSSEKNTKSVGLEVEIDGIGYKALALCDSGNLLTEPISGKSVILVSSKCDLGKKIDSYPELSKRFIPYSSTEKNGLLKGIIPQKIKIENNFVEAVIATVNNDFAGYEACVPTSLI